MKISKAIYDLMTPQLQGLFKANAAGDEYDNGEENATDLRTALQHERDENTGIKLKLGKFEADKAKEIEAARKQALETARTTGDFAAIEKDYNRRIKELQDTVDAAAIASESRTKEDAINAHIETLSKIFVSPDMAKPFIRSRLTAEIVDGKAIVRVLDANGKASAASVEDLKNEYLTAPALKASIVASKGSGGGAGLPPVSGGAGTGKDTKFDAAKATPAEMVAHLKAKPGFESGEAGD